MASRKIIIARVDISSDQEQTFALARPEAKELIKAITDYAEKRRNKGEEVFKQHHNIIVTESGYYLAFFDDELERIENKNTKS